MARIRQIKPEFALDEELAAACCIEARHLFVLMWMITDREGRLEDRPAKIKAQLFPYDDKVTTDVISSWIDQLCSGKWMFRYEVEGRRFLWIRTFKKHQHFHKDEQGSKLPEPPKDIELHRTCTVLASHLHDPSTVLSPETGSEPNWGNLSQITGNKGDAAIHRTCTPASTSTSTSGDRVSGIGIAPKGAVGPKKARTSPKTCCPPSFEIDESLKEWASKAAPGLDVEAETEKFLDYHRARGSSFKEWDAAWRNWIRNAIKFSGNGQGGPHAQHGSGNSRLSYADQVIAEGEAKMRAKSNG